MRDTKDATTRIDSLGTTGGTSWVAIAGGVLATMGVAALLTPVLTAYLATSGVDLTTAGSAIPVLIALGIASVIGGYTAGRIAKHQTGWHGLLAGLAALFLTGTYLVIGIAVQRSFLGINDRVLPEFFPMVMTISGYHSVAALTLGFVGFPAQVIAAWIGGSVARPRSAVVSSSPRIVPMAPMRTPRPVTV